MGANSFHRTHIPTKPGAIILGGMLLGMVLLIPQLSKNQDNRSRASASSTLAFVPTSSATTPVKQQVGNTFSLTFEVNPGTNLVSYIKYVINYDPTKIEVSAENPITVNTVSFPSILEGPVKSAGSISQTLSVGPDPSKVINTTTKVATINFKAIGETGSTPTVVTFGSNTALLSIHSNDGASENVLSSTSPSYLSISTTLVPTPTPNTCKEGVNGIRVLEPCAGNTFKAASYMCYDGKQGVLGGTSCRPSIQWQKAAMEACKGRTSCNASPTPTPKVFYPTPTPNYNYPTPTKAYFAPTPTINYNYPTPTRAY